MRLLLLGCVFVIALLGFLAATMPLGAAVRWAGLDDSRLTFEQAEGTVWKGRLTNAAYGATRLGDIDLAMRPFGLLTGRAVVDWTFVGQGVSGRGTAARGFDGTVFLEDMILEGRLDRLPTITPMAGRFDVALDTLRFGKTGCGAVKGSLRADPKILYGKGRQWTPPAMSGHPTCTDGVLAWPVSGQEGREAVLLTASLRPDLSYDLDLAIKTQDQAAQSAMTLIGFKARDGALAYRQQGILAAGQQ